MIEHGCNHDGLSWRPGHIECLADTREKVRRTTDEIDQETSDELGHHILRKDGLRQSLGRRSRTGVVNKPLPRLSCKERTVRRRQHRLQLLSSWSSRYVQHTPNGAD